MLRQKDLISSIMLTHFVVGLSFAQNISSAIVTDNTTTNANVSVEQNTPYSDLYLNVFYTIEGQDLNNNMDEIPQEEVSTDHKSNYMYSDVASDNLPIIKINDFNKGEGNSGLTAFAFKITLNKKSNQNVTVKYATANGTAVSGSDYTPINPKTLLFTPGETIKTITIQAKGDIVKELNESFFVNLTEPTGATLGDPQGRGIILNDDGAFLKINDFAKAEGNSGSINYPFLITLNSASTIPVSVKYATLGGTTTLGTDFTEVTSPTTVTFQPGETSKTIIIKGIGDTNKEPNETFFVNLSGAIGATLFDSQGKGTILNDDGPVLKINDVKKEEGNNGYTLFGFTITLNPTSADKVTVKYATANGTASAGSDFIAVTPTEVTFNPNEISKKVNINVKGDSVMEKDETFFVNLSNAVGATLFDGQGKGIISDDDATDLNKMKTAEFANSFWEIYSTENDTFITTYLLFNDLKQGENDWYVKGSNLYPYPGFPEDLLYGTAVQGGYDPKIGKYYIIDFSAEKDYMWEYIFDKNGDKITGCLYIYSFSDLDNSGPCNPVYGLR